MRWQYAVSSIQDYAERTEQTVAGWKSMNGLQSGDPAKLAGALVEDGACVALVARRRDRLQALAAGIENAGAQRWPSKRTSPTAPRPRRPSSRPPGNSGDWTSWSTVLA